MKELNWQHPRATMSSVMVGVYWLLISRCRVVVWALFSVFFIVLFFVIWWSHHPRHQNNGSHARQFFQIIKCSAKKGKNYLKILPPIHCFKAQIVSKLPSFKQLLYEVFVISGIIKVEVSGISQSRKLRLITLTETLINSAYHKNRI